MNNFFRSLAIASVCSLALIGCSKIPAGNVGVPDVVTVAR